MYNITMGIDQSLSCSGIVLFLDDDMIHHKTYKTSKDDGSLFKRCAMISKEIDTMLRQYAVTSVNIEGLSFGMSRGNVTRDLAALQGVIITSILSNHDIVCKIIPPKSVKKFATDNGKATKAEMIESLPDDILEKFKASGHKKTTGLADLADAYWIGKA